MRASRTSSSQSTTTTSRRLLWISSLALIGVTTSTSFAYAAGGGEEDAVSSREQKKRQKRQQLLRSGETQRQVVVDKVENENDGVADSFRVGLEDADLEINDPVLHDGLTDTSPTDGEGEENRTVVIAEREGDEPAKEEETVSTQHIRKAQLVTCGGFFSGTSDCHDSNSRLCGQSCSQDIQCACGTCIAQICTNGINNGGGNIGGVGCGRSCNFPGDCNGNGGCNFCMGGFCSSGGGDRLVGLCGETCDFNTPCGGDCPVCSGNRCVRSINGGGFNNGGVVVGGNCARTYQELETRFMNARNSGEVVMCAGRIQINSSNAIRVNTPNLTFRCQAGNGGINECVLNKRGRGGRILDWYSLGGRIQGITFENAGNSGINGGCIMISGGGRMEIVNSAFRNCEGNRGGAIFSQANAVPTLTNVIFTNNRAQVGGAAFVANVNLQNNYNSNSGNGNNANICNGIKIGENGACVNVNNGNGGNRLDNGGGFVGGCIGTFQGLQNALINNNFGQTIMVCPGIITFNAPLIIQGSNVRLQCQRLVQTVANTILVPECSFVGNGAFRLLVLGGNSNVIQGIAFRNGNANGNNGGAIHITGFGTEIDRCLFENNRARNGGAIYVEDSRQVQLYGSRFVSNTADTRGGAAVVGMGGSGQFVSAVGTSSNTGSGNSAPDCNDIYIAQTGFCENFIF